MKHHIKHSILYRLLAVILTAGMLTGASYGIVSADEFEDVGSGYQYGTAIDVLSSLGVLKGMDDGKFHPENNVTRAEFATLVIRALKLDYMANSVTDNYFSDVEDHWARGYVNLAAQNGYVSGFGDGKFHPDDAVTYEQAVKVMVCITGYQYSAEQNGGYPSGYIRTAGVNGITKAVSLAQGTELNRGQVAQLIYDTMNADLMKSNNLGADYAQYEKGGTLMDEFSDYADVKGIVTSVSGTSLDSPTGTNAADRVVIRTDSGELRVCSGTTNAQALLGREVRFYTDDADDDDYTLLYIRPTDNNKTISLKSEEIVKGEPDTGYTYRSGSTTKKLTLDSNVVYIYNGEYEESVTSAEMLPKDGDVTLLDNDADGKYEVVFINSYMHLIVSEYRVNNGVPTIYFKPGTKTEMGQLEIDPADRSSIVTVYRDGDVIIPDESTVIEKWMVASVAQSKSGETTNVYLSDKSVSGTVSSIYNDDYGMQYSINGEAYYVADSFAEDVKAGDEYTFLVSFNGRITGINTDSKATPGDYSLVLKTAYEDAEGKGYLKLLHADGTVQMHDVSADVVINDVRTETMSEAVLRNIGVYSLIKFTSSGNGEIIRIETADKSSVCTTTGGYIGYNKDKKFSLDASTDLYFNNVNPPTLGGDMKLDGNTVVFDLSSSDENEWGTGDYSLFSDDTVYSVDAYDLNEYKVAKVIVSYGTTLEEEQTVSWTGSPLLIESISTAVNEDGMTTYSVIGMQDGERITVLAKDMDITDDEGENRLEDMTPGSVIQVKKNLRGEITKIRKLYKAPTGTTVFDIMESRDWSGSDYNVKLHTVYGMCMNISESIMTVATRMNDQCRAYSIEGANIYLYRSASRKAETGTIYDVKPGSSYGYESCSRVFLRMEKDTVCDIVIYED